MTQDGQIGPLEWRRSTSVLRCSSLPSDSPKVPYGVSWVEVRWDAGDNGNSDRVVDPDQAPICDRKWMSCRRDSTSRSRPHRRYLSGTPVPLPALEIDSALLDGPKHRAVGVTIHLAHGPCQPAVAPFGNDTTLDAEGGAGISDGPVRTSSYRTIVNDPAPSVVIHEDYDPTDCRKTMILNKQIRERRRRHDASGYDHDSEPSHESECASTHLYLHGTRHDQWSTNVVNHGGHSATTRSRRLPSRLSGDLSGYQIPLAFEIVLIDQG